MAHDDPSPEHPSTPPPPPVPPGQQPPVAPPAVPPLPLPEDVGEVAPPPPVDDAEAAAERVRERALRHRTEQTRTYPCLQCGGELEWHIGQQLLKCPFCGNEQEVIDPDVEVVEQDFAEAVAALEAGALSNTGLQLEGEKEVVCQNCGGHTTFTGTLTATRCPYCATPIQRDDVHEAPARLAVDGVLPFQVDRSAADAAIDHWINSRWFAPNEFKKYATKGSFNSVYCAYFTYDSMTTTRYTGRRGDHYTVVVGSGENRRTETRTRWTYAAGTVRDSFDDLPVLANTGLDPRHVEALEPWPTHDARPFTAEYLAGHLSRTYDHDVVECFGTAKRRMEDAIRDTVRRDIGGDVQQITSMGVHYDMLRYKHLLLPVWLLAVIYEGRPFQVFINGVTGEVQGQRPYSKVKIALAVLVVLVLAITAYVLFGTSGETSTP